MHIPENVRYECVMCGKCCKALDVTVSSAFYKKASKEDWGKIHPKLKGKTIFRPYKNPGSSHTHRITHVPGKGCVFLDDDNKCIMHSAKGEAYKPIACRQFPYVFTETPGGTYAGCRFNCTSMKDQTGNLISSNKKYISKLHRDWASENPAYKNPKAIVFSKGMEIDWKNLQLIHKTVLQIMDNEKLSPLVALILIRETINSLKDMYDGQNTSAIETDQNALLESISKKYNKVRPKIIERVLFNQYLNIFLYPVRPDFFQFPFYKRASVRLGQFWGKMLLAFNMKKIILPDEQKRPVRKSAIWRVSPELDERTAKLLKTYLRTKIESHQFYGKGFFGYSYSDGFDCLIATYASIIIIARLHASVRQSNSLDYSDVACAIEEVDFSYGFNEIYNTSVEKSRISTMGKQNTPAKIAVHFSGDLVSKE
jgi:lysine-N-methylase